ncbi:MAG: bifunctional 4-hydroxy-2-oxoglutarate aldolase/2-dehydro-3-deoxy-phosphogluconate aldolase [Porticoccaceae bacterium]
MENSLHTIVARAPLMPVVTLRSGADAVPLARALLAGGLPVIEITLRTAAGLEAIRRIRAEVEGVIVGAGTVTTPADVDDALAAGAEFLVSPGATPALLNAGVGCGVPFMPGIATASELMTCVDKGLDILKFFPAHAIGGANALKALAGPFPQVSFCPTGGIGLAQLDEYFAIPAVKTLGGSWMAPASRIAEQEWRGITALAAQAVARVVELRPRGG